MWAKAARVSIGSLTVPPAEAPAGGSRVSLEQTVLVQRQSRFAERDTRLALAGSPADVCPQ